MDPCRYHEEKMARALEHIVYTESQVDYWRDESDRISRLLEQEEQRVSELQASLSQSRDSVDILDFQHRVMIRARQELEERVQQLEDHLRVRGLRVNEIEDHVYQRDLQVEQLEGDLHTSQQVFDIRTTQRDQLAVDLEVLRPDRELMLQGFWARLIDLGGWMPGLVHEIQPVEEVDPQVASGKPQPFIRGGNQNFNGKEKQSQIPTCSFCNKPGHTPDSCWRKAGKCLRCGNAQLQVKDCPMTGQSGNNPVPFPKPEHKMTDRSKM
ncbi:hypothetical protein DH2020_022187 [Rehmannia glutinosa]|uniref:CCHC-type domain-containing protein n=1 Tax=Rehmannia glutinosa TaxID=99300 RepID=A0ABR0WCM3_REHGL